MTQNRALGPSRITALVVASTMFMAQLDGAVVTLVLPDIARSFATTALNASVGISSYLLVQMILLPASGWISDRFGARRVFMAAICAFSVASALCAYSHTLPEFLSARVLQGFAAALMSAVGRIVLLHSTRKEHLVRVMSIATIPMLLAPSVGPILGGYISTYYSWPWIFLINVPIGILSMALTLRFIGRSKPLPRRPFDTVGFSLFGSASTLLIEGLNLISTDSRHWLMPAALIAMGSSIGVVAVSHVRRAQHPIISLSATKIQTYFIATLSGGALIRLPLRALSFLLPLMFQLAMGFSVIHAGTLLLVLSGSDLLIKTVTTRTLQTFGFRSVLISTAALSAATLAACSLFTPATPTAWVMALLFVGGTVRSLLFTSISSLALADVPADSLSSCSVLWNVMLQATNSLAVSISVIVLTLTATLGGELSGHLTLHDFRAALLVMAVLACLSLPSFLRLQDDAGAQLSGHRAPLR